MPAGFVKYLPSARMDCTVPRFAVSCRWYAVSRDLCGLADYRPIPRNTKVRPAYRASNVLLKIARNGKSPVPRSIRSTGLKLIWRCQSEWSCSQCLTFAAIPFPSFQTVEFSSSRLQSRRSIPRGFSLSVSSWLVAPFCP